MPSILHNIAVVFNVSNPNYEWRLKIKDYVVVKADDNVNKAIDLLCEIAERAISEYLNYVVRSHAVAALVNLYRLAGQLTWQITLMMLDVLANSAEMKVKKPSHCRTCVIFTVSLSYLRRLAYIAPASNPYKAQFIIGSRDYPYFNNSSSYFEYVLRDAIDHNCYARELSFSSFTLDLV